VGLVLWPVIFGFGVNLRFNSILPILLLLLEVSVRLCVRKKRYGHVHLSLSPPPYRAFAMSAIMKWNMLLDFERMEFDNLEKVRSRVLRYFCVLCQCYADADMIGCEMVDTSSPRAYDTTTDNRDRWYPRNHYHHHHQNVDETYKY